MLYEIYMVHSAPRSRRHGQATYGGYVYYIARRETPRAPQEYVMHSSCPLPFTSRNRSALMGLRELLWELYTIDSNPSGVVIYSRNNYLENCFNRLVDYWVNNGYRKRDGNTIFHRDLWEEIAELRAFFSENGTIRVRNPRESEEWGTSDIQESLEETIESVTQRAKKEFEERRKDKETIISWPNK